MEGIGFDIEGCDTILKHFKRQVTVRRNDEWLATRPITGKNEKGEPTFGDYEWKTWGKVDTITTNVARSIRAKNLAPIVQGEGKDQRFIAIWSKNREEWTMTLLAGMKVRTTVFGFYDAQGPESVNMIVDQTEL